MKLPTSAMALKTRNEYGLTLVEALLVFSLLSILLVGIFVFIDPLESRRRARDEKRFADIIILDRAAAEYLVDYGDYPDDAGVLRTSVQLPQGNAGPLENPATGWIKGNLSPYLTRLPTDPINDESFFYSYKRSDAGYEIDARLEFYSDKARNDGGNDLTVYEVGNALDIL